MRLAGWEIRKAAEEIRFVIGRSWLGQVLVATSDAGVVMISVGEDRRELLAEVEEAFPHADIVAGDREEKRVLKQVIDYIENPHGRLEVPLDLRGTEFQKTVWRAVTEVPAGKTASYSDIARAVGRPKAMRAVGTTCSKCLLSIAVPCHRILRSDGTFAAGAIYEPLLRRERSGTK